MFLFDQTTQRPARAKKETGKKLPVKGNNIIINKNDADKNRNTSRKEFLFVHILRHGCVLPRLFLLQMIQDGRGKSKMGF
jgi:hypothetical protein